jgi:hypothetical protein
MDAQKHFVHGCSSSNWTQQLWHLGDPGRSTNKRRIFEALHRKSLVINRPPPLSDFFFPAFSGNLLCQIYNCSCIDFRLFFFYLSLAVVGRYVSITPGDYACLHCTTCTQVPENIFGKFSPTPASTLQKSFFPQ